MKFSKQLLVILSAALLIWACSSSPIKNKIIAKEKPVRIANDRLEYEIIIIDIGFTTYLATIAEQEGFYNQDYLEARNRVWVLGWNQRFQDPQRFDNRIYENRIEYQPNIDYGYKVNYKLFNYFLFAQKKYKMNLGGGFRSDRIN
jgi:hypothetical protein